MANTYTQIHLHYVFAVKYRDAVIYLSWKDRLHRYITAIEEYKKLLEDFEVPYDGSYIFRDLENR